MNKKRLCLYSLFFIILITLTFSCVFKNTDIKLMIDNIKKINIIYIIICSILIIVYFLLQGIYMKLILNSLDKKISVFKGMFYSIVEFFFSGITPSSTGGQPAQIYFMSKDKIPFRKSIITLMLNTIHFKLFLIISSIFIFIFKSSLIFNNGLTFLIVFFLGLIVDIVITVSCYLLIFNQPLIKKIITFIYKLIDKIIKKDSFKFKIEDSITNYKREANQLHKHNFEIILSIIVTFVQRICLFSIPYVIYRAFGLNTYSYFDLLLIQICVQISIEALPLPGGTGASEHFINTIYITVFGASLASTGMILNRMLSFYIPLIIILFIILYMFKFVYNKKFHK